MWSFIVNRSQCLKTDVIFWMKLLCHCISLDKFSQNVQCTIPFKLDLPDQKSSASEMDDYDDVDSTVNPKEDESNSQGTV